VVAKVREKWAVSKQAALKFYVEKFNLRKLRELEVSKQYQIKTSNRFASLENLSDGENINRAWENVNDRGINGRITLRWMFRNWDVGLSTESILLRIGAVVGHLLMR